MLCAEESWTNAPCWSQKQVSPQCYPAGIVRPSWGCDGAQLLDLPSPSTGWKSPAHSLPLFLIPAEWKGREKSVPGLKALFEGPELGRLVRGAVSLSLIYSYHLNNFTFYAWVERCLVQVGKRGLLWPGSLGIKDSGWSHLSQRSAQSSGPTPSPSDPAPRARVNHAKGRGQPVRSLCVQSVSQPVSSSAICVCSAVC